MDIEQLFSSIAEIQHQLENTELSDTAIISSIIVIFIVNIALQLSLTYFRKKTENIATKEDIQDITREIESVKNSYRSMLEEYKKELDHKYEAFSLVTETKTEIYKKLAKVQQKIRERIHNLGDEPSQLEFIFNELPASLIKLQSYAFISNSNDIQEAMNNCQDQYNSLSVQIENFRQSKSPSTQIDYRELLTSIEELQDSLIRY